jgi:hypothetical protein
VTSELCGHWDHDGACAWPHNNELQNGTPPRLRVIFVAEEAQREEVLQRISVALGSSADWSVEGGGVRQIRADEMELSRRLLNAPR